MDKQSDKKSNGDIDQLLALCNSLLDPVTIQAALKIGHLGTALI